MEGLREASYEQLRLLRRPVGLPNFCPYLPPPQIAELFPAAVKADVPNLISAVAKDSTGCGQTKDGDLSQTCSRLGSDVSENRCAAVEV
jgi:hypothetical protein